MKLNPKTVNIKTVVGAWILLEHAHHHLRHQGGHIMLNHQRFDLKKKTDLILLEKMKMSIVKATLFRNLKSSLVIQSTIKK